MSAVIAAVSGIKEEDNTISSLPEERPTRRSPEHSPTRTRVAAINEQQPDDDLEPTHCARTRSVMQVALQVDSPTAVGAASEKPEGEPSRLHVFGTRQKGVIGRDKPRAVVRIERDYTSGEVVQFFGGWMWEFESRITPRQYESIMSEINDVLASAHDPSKSFWDNIVAVLTLYLSPKTIGSHFEREMTRFQQVLQKANRDVLNPVGLNVLSPRRNGFLYLDFEYY
ncbi:hypothetical protein ACM66B_002996 [Microbotryomycetes sp. NB124-2]